MFCRMVVRKLAFTNIFYFSISLVSISLILRAFVHAIKYIFRIPDFQIRDELINHDYDITVNFLINSLVFAPILETILFQSFFFYIYKKFRINKFVIVFISGLVFAVIHNYSIIRMVDAGLIGFTFMYLYILREKTNKKPQLSTITAHLFMNLFAILAMLVSKLFA